MKTLSAFKVSVIATAMASIVACSKTDNLATAELGKSSCTAQKTSASPDTLSIEGGTAAKPGEPVRYSLSEDLSCSENQTVAWRTVAGGTRLGKSDGSAFVSSFRKPGEYVVAAQVTSADSNSTYEVTTKTVVDDGVALVGPVYGMAELDHHFELSIPAGVSVASATWDFGDGSGAVNSLAPQDHIYMTAGDFIVTVTVTGTDGQSAELQHLIHVLPPTDGMECVRDLAVSGPSTGTVGSPVSLSVYIPQCLSWRIVSVNWNFGDGSNTSGNQSIQHTYTQAGHYAIVVTLYSREAPNTPFLTISREIDITGGGTEEPEEPEEPEQPGPTHECTTLGQTRESSGEIYSEEVACGVNGTKRMSYRDRVTQTCLMNGEIQRWTETSRQRELTSEGECTSQACELPPQALTGVDVVALGIIQIGGKYYLPHGGSKTFYSSQTPAGACSEVAETRTCVNGVLGGSTANVYLMCNNGCPGVGPHGTVQTGVVTGETQLPKQCQFGETGITDLFHVISDRTCDRGTVVTSNSRTGGIKLAGVCPAYEWVATDAWSGCSADCGGKQTRVYECRQVGGSEAVPRERCTAAAPVDERVCDGNPNAVRRTEASTVTEDASSTMKCPANQIGTISKTRQTTTTKVYACINHAVAVESETVTSTPWVEERFCRDYVAHRCSNDSINIPQATERFEWMKKCRAQVPKIDEFLTQFEATQKAKLAGKGLMYDTRYVYATFMNTAYKPERVWKAPVDRKASCDVPETVYVAAVCVASCSTPEQQILAQDKANGQLKYAPFIEAWEKNFAFVGTLASNSSMSSKTVQKTKVDQWVTELENAEHDIIVFTMKSGRVLKLTPNHPLVTDQGSMRQAQDFKVGDNLVMLGGVGDPIAKMEKIKYFGKVYNVFVESASLHKNIVVTNGYLNGTAYFQNDGAQHLNRRILRGALIKGVLAK
jgi:PKD repeat protein